MKITITKFYSNIGMIVDSGFCFGFGVLSFFFFCFPSLFPNWEILIYMKSLQC